MARGRLPRAVRKREPIVVGPEAAPLIDLFIRIQRRIDADEARAVELESAVRDEKAKK